MKTNYFYAVVFGIMVLTTTSRSQNILFDGDFSVTTEIVPFDESTPTVDQWAYRVEDQIGAEANPSIIDGVANLKILQSGETYGDIELGQWGFPLILNHSYQVTFDVKAELGSVIKVFLGEEGESDTNLLGDSYYFAEPEWKTITINFKTTSVFDLHKLSFQFGADINTTLYFDNILLLDLGPVPVLKVSLFGNLQNELGCGFDYDYFCESPALLFNSETQTWAGNYTLPPGCYSYQVKETTSYDETLYGENGIEGGNEIQLYVPEEGEVTFSYDPQNHILSSTPYNSFPQEVIKVSLVGDLQDELGCSSDFDFECDIPLLNQNPDNGFWEGNFFLPSGCYTFHIKESFACNTIYYGENGVQGANAIQLYIPVDAEVTFSYDPEIHAINSSPYSGNPQEITEVFLIGNFQDEMGCTYDYEPNCDISSLIFNSDSGEWEGDFVLPAGCYTYQVKEVMGCEIFYYGENGIEGSANQLYVPSEGEVIFSYDPQTHIINSTPYSGVPQEASKVSLIGSFQSEMGCEYDFDNFCDNLELEFNSYSGKWEGGFTIPSGCYFYGVKETSACDFRFYGENGEQGGQNIPIYIPTESEILFSYDPQTHLIVSTPFSGIPQEVTSVSLVGDLQDELGCTSDNDYECNKPALQLNPETGNWIGSFILPAGCYTYRIKETFACNAGVLYGEDGQESGSEIQLYLPLEGEVILNYDPESHIITSTPYGKVPPEMMKVFLVGSLQDELGCAYDWEEECESSALEYSTELGTWEGTFNLPAGCYSYRVKEESVCGTEYYGESGGEIQLFIPSNGEISFTYDPRTHAISSNPYSGVPQEVTAVTLVGSFQNELGCGSDEDELCDQTALIFEPVSNTWRGNFNLPAGCYSYRVKETIGCEVIFYGENGISWGEAIQLFIPSNEDIDFTYNPETHIISSTPYSGVPQEVTEVSLVGSLQDELGCLSDDDFQCDTPKLNYNPDTSVWEGSFNLSAGCYNYKVKETFSCNDGILFGENGEAWGDSVQLYVPSDGVITFSYDPQTHVVSSTPYSSVPPEMTAVSIIGSLQEEMGCNSDYEDECENSSLVYNSDSGLWEGTFTLPPGCYVYLVKEVDVCGIDYYGVNGNEVQLYMPEEAEITFSYDPQTNLINSTPYIGVPEEITSVSLTGTFQEEFGCDSNNFPECDQPALVYDPDSATWKGSFTLSAGCHSYWVKETFGCDWTLYGENGSYWGDQIQLYIPEEGEVSFSYDPETRIVTSTPYSGIPQEVTAVSLSGFPAEVVCAPAGNNCIDPALQFNSDTGRWEGSFRLPAGCYDYWVKEESMCNVFYYGENGGAGQSIRLYVPEDAVITFSYNPQTHILTSSPYSGVPQEVTEVALRGTLQGELGCNEDWEDQCDYSTLALNPASGLWEGNFLLPEGCYTYQIKERFGCEVTYYGENGEPWGEIQIYIHAEGVVTFQYDPVSHIVSSTPYSGIPQEVTEVSLVGSVQEELGCTSDWQAECSNSALLFNPDSGLWERTFSLPAGCYTYQIKETSLCKSVYYGENGTEWGVIELYVPFDGEISFRYDPELNTIVSTPYSGVPQEVTNVNLVGSLDGEYGSISLSKNEISGKWEGTYMAPAGCYAYMIEEVFGCTSVQYFGQNGVEWGEEIPLFVSSKTEITFSYDPETHLITSLPDIPNVSQCPEDIIVDNTLGTCGTVVEYPDFTDTTECGGEIVSATQTAGLPSGSEFPIGTTTNTYDLVKTTGEVITCSFDVIVTDTEAPVIADLQENYEPLWPPNHKMIPVYLDYVAWDNCSIAGSEITITSNEPENTGKGDKAPDWEIVDEHNVMLRAERDAKGTGREYYITIKVTDDSGNFTEQTVTVMVPKDNSKTTAEIFESESSNDKYVLYPNAADDIIRIKGPDNFSDFRYLIFDMLGVMKRQGTSNNDQIEVSSLPSGTYTVKFETAKGYIFKRFIKK